MLEARVGGGESNGGGSRTSTNLGDIFEAIKKADIQGAKTDAVDARLIQWVEVHQESFFGGGIFPGRFCIRQRNIMIRKFHDVGGGEF